MRPLVRRGLAAVLLLVVLGGDIGLVLTDASAWGKRGASGLCFLCRQSRDRFERALVYGSNAGQEWGTVVYVLPKGPAARAGIRTGDLILDVNGVPPASARS